MKETWSAAIKLLLASEGAELNVSPGEPGGASRYGVSVAALGDLHRARGLGPVTVDTIRALTEPQAEDFYRVVTAAACGFDALPAGVDYVMLDVTCNLGPAGGAWLLQSVLGVWPQGNAVTAQVTALASSVAPKTLVYALGAGWLAVKRRSDAWPRAGHGWTNRMVRVRADALNMTGEK